jgi:hypothetical protein
MTSSGAKDLIRHTDSPFIDSTVRLYTLRNSFPKFVFVFTLALSVNNLLEERRKTDAEFVFLLFPHKVTWALPYMVERR